MMYLQGLTRNEFNTLAQEVKQTIPFRVRFCQHTQQQYARGQFDICPTKKDGYRWTEEQFNIVRAFLIERSYRIGQMDILTGDTGYYCFRSGICYISKVVH